MTKLQNICSVLSGYEEIASLYCQHKDKSFEKIPVGLYQWFDANMTAVLGAVFDLLEDNLNTIVFNHIDSKIQNILQRNDFLSHFGYPHQADSLGTTIQYQKMKPDDGRYFQEYVSTQFLNRSELPKMSVGLHRKMNEAMLELFNNAKIHSETKYIYTCGQFFPKLHLVEFCIVDTGIGFKERFKRRFGKKISSIDAICWSVENGHTTKIDVTGGIGLAILNEFIKLNNGRLQIVSHDGFYQYDSSGEQAKTLNTSFPGTIVNVMFCTTDTHSYSLVGEVNRTDLF